MGAYRKSKIRISGVSPPAAIPGGRLVIRGSGLGADEASQPKVTFGTATGRLILSAPDRLVVTVPDSAGHGVLRVQHGDAASEHCPFALGRSLGNELNPVANPAIDSDGNIFTTNSGPRGKKTPVSVYKIATDGAAASAFLSGIYNPTGLLFQRNGQLLVSSRHMGTVYDVSPKGEAEVFAEGMGVATGLARDSADNVYVGDRTGTVFKIGPDRKIYVFATLEPSVAAYHLAAAADGTLYVTAPTTSSYDAIYKIDPEGEVAVWRRGFGRPQGIAYDSLQRLYVCASYRGQRGIFRLTDEDVEQVVSGQGIVGLAFAPDGSMAVATQDRIYLIADFD